MRFYCSDHGGVLFCSRNLLLSIHFHNVPVGIVEIFRMAFSTRGSCYGGGRFHHCGMFSAMRWGVARGYFQMKRFWPSPIK